MKEILNSLQALLQTVIKDRMVATLVVSWIFCLFIGRIAWDAMGTNYELQQSVVKAKDDCTKAINVLQLRYEDRLQTEIKTLQDKEKEVDSMYLDLRTKNK